MEGCDSTLELLPLGEDQSNQQVTLRRTDLTRWINQFCLDKRILVGVSAQTLRWYRISLDAFKGVLADGASPDGIRRRIGEMLDAGVKPVTVNSYTRAVNAFLAWLRDEGHIRRPSSIPRLIEPQQVPRTWSHEEVDTYSRSSPGGRRHLRVYTIGYLLLDSGMRIGEALPLRWGDVSWSPRIILVAGKGRRERLVPYSDHAERVLYRWRRTQPAATVGDLVFPSVRGTVLGYQNIDSDWHELLKSIGISPCGFHVLRHTFATHYLASGGNSVDLQRILGHSTMDMTARYVAMRVDGLSDSQQRYSPFSLRLSGNTSTGRTNFTLTRVGKV